MGMKRGYIVALAALAISGIAVYAGPGGGTIAGKVSYTGTPAKMKPIDMSKEPSCAKQYTEPPKTETVVTGAGNTLDNVVVYVSAGVPDETTPASDKKSFDQKGCRYMPHVLALQVNQTFEIVNSDQTSHNIHPLPKTNPEWNKSQPPGTPPMTAKYDKPEFIPVKCNIHPWMHGNFAVLKNSHYAVTEGDGEFKLPNLPAGKYTITAWHESYGEQTQDVTLSGSETKTITFTFVAKPY